MMIYTLVHMFASSTFNIFIHHVLGTPAKAPILYPTSYVSLPQPQAKNKVQISQAEIKITTFFKKKIKVSIPFQKAVKISTQQ